MRAWWQEEADAGSDVGFSPVFRFAICENVDPGRLREPWWHAVRFDSTRYRVIERLLGILGFEYRLFTYLHHRARRAPAVRSWLPGYFFVEFDARDEWRQLRDIPGVIQVFDDAPISSVIIEDLVVRLIDPAGDPAGECESLPRGSSVKILVGTFSGRQAVVTWSERKRVRILMMMFERPMEIEFRTRDVEAV